MGFPVVDRHGQVQFPGQLQLGLKQGVLLLAGHGPVVVEADLPYRDNGGVLIQRTHGGKLGAPIAVVDGHGGGVLLDETFRVDAQRGVEVRRGVRQFQHLLGVAGVGGTFQHAHHAAPGQRGQQVGTVAVKLAAGIMGMGVKNIRHGSAFLWLRGAVD